MKLMDLAIPMGWRDHFKEYVEFVKGCEEKYAQAKKFIGAGSKMIWKTCQQNTKACAI
jgi:hypothetical protein